MLVSLKVSYKTFFIFNSRGTGISDVIYRLLNIMGWTMCSKNFERSKFQFRCLLCFSRDYFFTFSFESTNLYQEQQIPRTTNYGLECIRYQAAKIWNSLSDSMRTMTSFKDFKKAIKEMNF